MRNGWGYTIAQVILWLTAAWFILGCAPDLTLDVQTPDPPDPFSDLKAEGCWFIHTDYHEPTNESPFAFRIVVKFGDSMKPSIAVTHATTFDWALVRILAGVREAKKVRGKPYVPKPRIDNSPPATHWKTHARRE